MIVTGKRCVVAGWSVTLDTQMWQHIKRTNTTQPTDDMHYTAGETRATHNAHLVFRREVTHGGVTCNKITAWCVGMWMSCREHTDHGDETLCVVGGDGINTKKLLYCQRSDNGRELCTSCISKINTQV